MTQDQPPPGAVTGRREPPPFRRVHVVRTKSVGQRMTRVVLGGEDLEGLTIDEPAASVRLLIPPPGSGLEVPTWRGNEFLLGDGGRPLIRTFTPRRLQDNELTLDLVIHKGGAASQWAGTAREGSPAAISGPGRGFAVDPSAPRFILAGDETAVPAIAQLIESIPDAIPVQVHVEVESGFGTVDLPQRSRLSVSWHDVGDVRGDTLLTALRASDTVADSIFWCAGNAAAMQRIRKHLFGERGVPRSRATIRGYWKTAAT